MELYQDFGADLVASANGDVLLADSVILSQQSVLRRLLTNPGDYIWHPEYGAGLPAMVGAPINADVVKNVIQSQMLLEDSVVPFPAPVVTVQPIPNGMFVSISYTEADSQQPVVLKFNVT